MNGETHFKYTTIYILPFQIAKCDDRTCCKEPALDRELREWLPDPILDSEGEHYLPLDDVIGTETTDRDRPSAKPSHKAGGKTTTSIVDYFLLDELVCTYFFVVSTECAFLTHNCIADLSSFVFDGFVFCLIFFFQEDQRKNTGLFTQQHARGVIQCLECGKSRVYYAKTALSSRHKLELAVQMSQYEFTCGSPLLPPDHPLAHTIQTRLALTCGDVLEISYYKLGRADSCAYCGKTGGVVDQELKARFKTVMPLCVSCCNKGKKPVCQRPFGKRK